MSQKPVIEEYFVIKFSSGTYYNGTRYSSKTLDKAVKFNDYNEATEEVNRISQDRCVDMTVVPIIINEAMAYKELLQASQQALSLLKGEKEFDEDLTIYGPGGKNVVRINRVIELLKQLFRIPFRQHESFAG